MPLLGIMGSLTLDYLTRMKVSASLNWFYVETLPIASGWRNESFVTLCCDLVYRLNALGADFERPAREPLVHGRERAATRLVLDALVADLYELDVKDMEHIATRFPSYDRKAGEYSYPNMAIEVYRALVDGGFELAENKAGELSRARASSGYDFGLDEVYVPKDGWERANAEARKILEAG